MTEKEIIYEIFEWINKNDCRSISIVYRYAEVKYNHWLDVLKARERYRGIKFYIKSRNYGQRADGVRAPEGMTLYKKYVVFNQSFKRWRIRNYFKSK